MDSMHCKRPRGLETTKKRAEFSYIKLQKKTPAVAGSRLRHGPTATIAQTALHRKDHGRPDTTEPGGSCISKTASRATTCTYARTRRDVCANCCF